MSHKILIGLCLAAGIWLVASALLARRTVDFSDRIAPQMKSQEIHASLRYESQQAQMGMGESFVELLRPFIRTALARFNHSTINTTALEKRLIRSGLNLSVSSFRAEQLVWSLIGLVAAALFMGLGMIQGKISVAGALAICVLSAVAGYLARDWWLTQTIEKRESKMLEEFPALAELMALSVTAGESAAGALERVCRCSSGELSGEFKKILAQIRSGDGLVRSLQDFSARTEIAPLARFVDGIVVAIERGTPLSEVLRAQAQDVRDSSKRQLMEAAGKKEIAMMAPIIFCILPLTVVFALFPGLSLINFKF